MSADPTAKLNEQGIAAVFVRSEADLDSVGTNPSPWLAIVDATSMSRSDLRRCILRCTQMKLPAIALAPKARVAEMDASVGLVDFIVSPADPAELIARAKRALFQSGPPGDADAIRIGDLVIDPAGYEVSLRGKRVTLTFKEYELLRLLATNPGRVYTRDALLSQIWGYAYFGGTRTVDVHIRRLRSKIEDAEHTFIETIWTVGYRFRDPSTLSDSGPGSTPPGARPATP